MVEIFYRYRVHSSQVRAFEHAYGPAGPWAKLFARHPGYKRTRLFRHKLEPDIYVTVDIWESKADWDAFRKMYSEDYRRLDKQLALLKLEEHLLGFYEGEEEYKPPIDTHA
jgi:heme-degrading monooxygenase HmoA